MASDEDPFATLGVEASASPDEIRQAYVRLLREHQSTGGTARIPRLLRAYELAFALAQMRDEAGAIDPAGHSTSGKLGGHFGARENEEAHATGEGWYRTISDPFRRPAGGWSRDPLVTRVRRHVEAGALDDAVEVAISPEWQQRVADGEADFAHATMRLACATVWAAPEAYERLAHTYIDRLEDLAGDYCASALPLMLALDSDWVGWRTFRDVETWLVDFLQRGMSGDQMFLRRVAREIKEVLADDPRRLLHQLETMAALSPALVAFTAHLARNIPTDLGLPTFPDQDIEEIDPAAVEALFPYVRMTMLLPLLMVAIVASPGNALGILVCSGGVLIYRDAWYAGWYRLRLRHRLLDFCLEHQLPPRSLAGWASAQPLLSRPRPYADLVDDVVLDAAYALARLANLLGRG